MYILFFFPPVFRLNSVRWIAWWKRQTNSWWGSKAGTDNERGRELRSGSPISHWLCYVPKSSSSGSIHMLIVISKRRWGSEKRGWKREAEKIERERESRKGEGRRGTSYMPSSQPLSLQTFPSFFLLPIQLLATISLLPLGFHADLYEFNSIVQLSPLPFPSLSLLPFHICLSVSHVSSLPISFLPSLPDSVIGHPKQWMLLNSHFAPSFPVHLLLRFLLLSLSLSPCSSNPGLSTPTYSFELEL